MQNGPYCQAVVLPSWFSGVAGSLLRTFDHFKGQASIWTKGRYKSQIHDENSHILGIIVGYSTITNNEKSTFCEYTPILFHLNWSGGNMDGADCIGGKGKTPCIPITNCNTNTKSNTFINNNNIQHGDSAAS